MGTDVSLVKSLMLSLIPDDYKTDIADDYDIIERGIIEMSVSLGLDVIINYETITEGEGEEQTEVRIPVSCSPTLTVQQAYLASYYAYRAYLLKLKDELNRDAINFKTLTFEIKSLEKRPEAINDTLYQVNRYLSNVINETKGSGCVKGRVVKFGGVTQ